MESAERETALTRTSWNQLGVLASLALLGLSTIEFWSVLQIDQHFWGGPLVGAVTVLTLLVCARQATSKASSWANRLTAVAISIAELAFSVALITSFTAIMLVLTPSGHLSTLLGNDSANEFIVLSLGLVSLLIGARGWYKYSRRIVAEAKSSSAAAEDRAILAEKQRELTNAELRILRAQIEPHFLWNTLAQLQYLIRKNPDAAEKMSEHLIRFLMHVLAQSRQDKITLQDEFNSAEAYLEIMKIRMGDRLSVEVTLDPALAPVAFPSLLLQTLVENAIKHGIEPKVGPVSVIVRAYKVLGTTPQVVLEVEDDGVGLKPGATPGTGLGLSSVRDRLNAHYGGTAALSIASRQVGGVVARIQFPLGHSAPEESNA